MTTVPTGDEADTIDATEAWARHQPAAADAWAIAVPPPGAHAGHPPPLVVTPPRSSAVSVADLRGVAADAAARAWALMRGEGDGELDLSADHDLARRAASVVGTPALEELARRAGVPARHLERHALAWRHGGREGLEVLTETWMADPDALDEGRRVMVESLGASLRFADDAPTRPIKQRANTLILGPVQLRLARSGRWYRLAKVASHWVVEDGPAADPAELFTNS